MKFLVFNLVVAGALVYLFTADKADMQRASAALTATGTKVQAATRDALATVIPPEKTVTAVPQEVPAPAVHTPEPPQPPAPPQVSAAPPTPPAEKTPNPSSQPSPKKLAADTAPKAMPKPKPKPTPLLAVATTRDDAPPPAPAPTIDVTSAPLDAGALARRAEIMGDIQAGPQPILKDGETLMPAVERERALRDIADDMELMYARSIGQ